MRIGYCCSGSSLALAKHSLSKLAPQDKDSQTSIGSDAVEVIFQSVLKYSLVKWDVLGSDRHNHLITMYYYVAQIDFLYNAFALIGSLLSNFSTRGIWFLNYN